MSVVVTVSWQPSWRDRVFRRSSRSTWTIRCSAGLGSEAVISASRGYTVTCWTRASNRHLA